MKTIEDIKNDWVNMVLDFHKAMEVDYYEQPTLIPIERIELRKNILNEEIDELEIAMDDNNLPLIADAIIDSIYVLIGTSWEYGLGNFMNKLFAEVHRSNMSKLHNGVCVKREDGKVLKSPNYSKPDLEPIIRCS